MNRDTHKYNQGKVLILAGSKGMTGAAYLSTIATLRAGAGLTKTCAPASINDIYEKKITEGMTISCEDNGLGYFSKSNYEIKDVLFNDQLITLISNASSKFI